MSEAPDLLAALARSIEKVREERLAKMPDHIEQAMRLFDEHEYMTGGRYGHDAPLVCSCGHREKSTLGETLQRVHQKHLLTVADGLGLLSQYPHLEVDGNWLVEVVNEHTCGAGPGSGAGHEPDCGTIPVGRLATLEYDASVLREAATAMEDEDGREWPFNGLDEMQRWLRLRADRIERGVTDA